MPPPSRCLPVCENNESFIFAARGRGEGKGIRRICFLDRNDGSENCACQGIGKSLGMNHLWVWGTRWGVLNQPVTECRKMALTHVECVWFPLFPEGGNVRVAPSCRETGNGCKKGILSGMLNYTMRASLRGEDSCMIMRCRLLLCIAETGVFSS